MVRTPPHRLLLLGRLRPRSNRRHPIQHNQPSRNDPGPPRANRGNRHTGTSSGQRSFDPDLMGNRRQQPQRLPLRSPVPQPPLRIPRELGTTPLHPRVLVRRTPRMERTMVRTPPHRLLLLGRLRPRDNRRHPIQHNPLLTRQRKTRTPGASGSARQSPLAEALRDHGSRQDNSPFGVVLLD